MKKKWIVITALGLVGLSAGVYAFTQRGGTPIEGAIVSVKRARIQVSVQEVGSVEPLRKVEIKSKVAGQVSAVLVDVGDKVKVGDLLIKLDTLDSSRDVRQMDAKAQITQAQLKLAEAQADFKRKAHKDGALSDLELNVAEGEIKRLQAQASYEQVDLQGSRDRLGYTQIRAPIDGIVLARNVQPGEMIAPGVASVVTGTPLLVVAQIEKLLVRTELNQIDVARIKRDDAVAITVDALPGQKFVGSIFRIAAMAAKSERRKESNLMIFPVDVIVDRSQPGAEGLRPGMMADITIALEGKDDVLIAPIEAIVREDGKARVWKVEAVEGGKKEKDIPVEVTLGLQNEREVELKDGVAEGARIRVNPPQTEHRMKM